MVHNILVALAFAGASSPLAGAPFSVHFVDVSGRPVRSASFQVRLRPPPAAMPMADY